MSSGLDYAERPYQVEILIPRYQYDPKIHESSINPGFVATTLLKGWNFLRNNIKSELNKAISEQKDESISLEFIYQLNEIFTPDTFSIFKAHQESWKENDKGPHFNSHPFIAVDFDGIQSHQIDQLPKTYRELFQNPELNISFLFIKQSSPSAPLINIELPPLFIKELADYHKEQSKLGFTKTEERPHLLSRNDACSILTSCADKITNRAIFPYHLNACDHHPAKPHLNKSVEVNDKIGLYYPFCTYYQANKIILPDLLMRYQQDLLAAEDRNQLILTIADYTQLFLVLHPFLDGNGRTFRFFANYVLMLHGLAPAAFDDFVAIPTTKEEWRSLFVAAQWRGQQLYDHP